MSQSEEIYAEVSSRSPPMAEERFDVDDNKCYGTLKVVQLKQKNIEAVNGEKVMKVTMVLIVILILAAIVTCCIALTLDTQTEVSNLLS